MDLGDISREARQFFDAKTAVRDQALSAARLSIRSSANAIRAIHRGEPDAAHELMDESRSALDRASEAVRDYPDLTFAGYLQDAEKEYAEARITEAVVTESEIPGPEEIGVKVAPYLNGMAEAIGEARRHILDSLRAGEVERSEAMLTTMEDMYYILVSMDYPDAVTGNLRRSTDVARGIMERTRGDLSLSLVQRDLRQALERHADDVLGKE